MLTAGQNDSNIGGFVVAKWDEYRCWDTQLRERAAAENADAGARIRSHVTLPHSPPSCAIHMSRCNEHLRCDHATQASFDHELDSGGPTHGSSSA